MIVVYMVIIFMTSSTYPYLVQTVVLLCEGDNTLAVEVVRLVPMAEVKVPDLLYGEESCLHA